MTRHRRVAGGLTRVVAMVGATHVGCGSHRAIRESGGTALSVSDDEMLAEIPRVGKAEGIFFCPEGAACVAALRCLVENSWIHPNDEVLIFNTASGLKYIDLIHRPFLPSSQTRN